MNTFLVNYQYKNNSTNKEIWNNRYQFIQASSKKEARNLFLARFKDSFPFNLIKVVSIKENKRS